MPKRATTIRIDDPLRQRIHQCAQEHGISDADLIRQAIIFYLGWLHGQQPPPPELPELPGE